jgi:carboxylesterase type B
MNRNQFYKKYEELPRDKRFEPFSPAPHITSLFVIFQQLSQVKAQLRYFEKREEELLKQADEYLQRP